MTTLRLMLRIPSALGIYVGAFPMPTLQHVQVTTAKLHKYSNYHDEWQLYPSMNVVPSHGWNWLFHSRYWFVKIKRLRKYNSHSRRICNLTIMTCNLPREACQIMIGCHSPQSVHQTIDANILLNNLCGLYQAYFSHMKFELGILFFLMRLCHDML